MDKKEHIEFTIRVAQVGKHVMGMVGCADKTLAKLMYKQVVDELAELAEFLDR